MLCKSHIWVAVEPSVQLFFHKGILSTKDKNHAKTDIKVSWSFHILLNYFNLLKYILQKIVKTIELGKIR